MPVVKSWVGSFDHVTGIAVARTIASRRTKRNRHFDNVLRRGICAKTGELISAELLRVLKCQHLGYNIAHVERLWTEAWECLLPESCPHISTPCCCAHRFSRTTATSTHANDRLAACCGRYARKSPPAVSELLGDTDFSAVIAKCAC